MKRIFGRRLFPAIAAVLFALLASVAHAGQGAVRMLYTVPNSTFIARPAGDTNVITINDASGSIVTLQSNINSTRSANPNSIIVIRLLNGATYSVSGAGL